MLHVIMLLIQSATPVATIDATRSITGEVPAEGPCRLKDRRGRPIGFDPKICKALVEYLSPSARTFDPPHTLLELVVDRSGKVKSCSVLESSGAPDLDARSCSIAIDKARYAVPPGKDGMQRRTTRLRIDWPRSLPVRPTTPSATVVRAAPPPRAVPRPPVRIAPPPPAEPAGPSYDQRLAAQQGVRGREPTQGWTIGD